MDVNVTKKTSTFTSKRLQDLKKLTDVYVTEVATKNLNDLQNRGGNFTTKPHNCDIRIDTKVTILN